MVKIERKRRRALAHDMDAEIERYANPLNFLSGIRAV
jgi:hypothetical protein